MNKAGDLGVQKTVGKEVAISFLKSKDIGNERIPPDHKGFRDTLFTVYASQTAFLNRVLTPRWAVPALSSII